MDEKAAEAKALLENPVLKEALDMVYSRAAGILLNTDVGSLTASTAHATMKAVTQLRSQLEQFVADSRMRQKFSKGDPNA